MESKKLRKQKTSSACACMFKDRVGMLLTGCSVVFAVVTQLLRRDGSSEEEGERVEDIPEGGGVKVGGGGG